MGWLFFVSAIKERFLKIPHCPQGISEESWKLVKEWFTDEDSWDSNVVNVILNENIKKEHKKHKKEIEKIFHVPKDLPTLIKAYRKYRNICAHGKDYNISYSHVEALWGFIIDALSKIAIAGEIEVFVNRLADIFEKFGSDNDKLIATSLYQALQLISVESFSKFLDMLNNELKNKNMPEMTRYEVTAKLYEILQNFSKRSPEYRKYSEELIKYILQKDDIDIQVFAGLYPESLRDILTQRPIYAEEIIGLIENTLREEEKDIPPYLLPQFLELLLMGPSYLSSDSLDKCRKLVKRIPYKLTDWSILEAYELLSRKPELVKILEEYGFFETFKRVLLDKVIVPKGHSFTIANERSLLPAIYIEYKGLDEDLVERISIVFSDKDEHYPYDVRDALEAYFNKNPEKWNEFKNIFQKLKESGKLRVSLNEIYINPEKETE